ncbi:hypothetical protein [Nocardioides cynanchi]|uniref:hypothetical protein n=1 Tax=Nocardioides cynanchi TaxID=2558918 RepID=UPI0012480636|nr:hypothetical protein [Nocardioides cynanchi]
MRLLAATALAAALAAAALVPLTGLPAAGAAPASHTHRVVVRPVDASGHAVSGWTVHRERGFTVQCDGPAPAAVDDGIGACFPTAAYLPACWKSHHHTALCLRDARSKALVRVRYSGAFTAPNAPAHATPQDLDLTGGQRCSIRFGGAWGQLPSHPNWLGFDSCTKGSVYGPPSGDGIDRSTPVWTVHVWKSGTRSRVVTRGVGTAYYVGTAA